MEITYEELSDLIREAIEQEQEEIMRDIWRANMQSKTYINNQLQQEWITWDPLLRKDLERFEYRLQACYYSMYLTTGANQKMRESFVLPRIIEIIKSMG